MSEGLTAEQEHLAAEHENGQHDFGCPEGCPDEPTLSEKVEAGLTEPHVPDYMQEEL